MSEEIRGANSPNDGRDWKEWLTPKLRRLPIAATSGGGIFNEGVGKGKGESGPQQIS